MKTYRWIYGALALTTLIAAVSVFEAGVAAYATHHTIQVFKSMDKDTLGFQVLFERQIGWVFDALVVLICQGIIFFFVRRLMFPKE